MSTPSTIAAKWREAKTILSGMVSKAPQFSDFEGMLASVPAPEGYFKLADWVIPGKFKTRSGTATVNGVSAFSKEYTTSVKEYLIEVDKDLMERTDAISMGEFSRIVRSIGSGMMADRDERMTALLTTPGTDIFNVSFLGSHTIPDTAVTFNNILTGAGVTAANIQTDFWAAVAHFSTLAGSTGYRYHGSRGKGLRYVAMYPAALEEVMQNAFAAQLGSNGGSNVAFNKVELRVNPSLDATSESDWYLEVLDDNYPVIVEGVGKALEFSETQVNDSYVIINGKHLMKVEYKSGFAPGSPMHLVRINNV
jgi:hypothetical protein